MLTAALPDGSNLFAATSMPVRDVEWYSAPRSGLRVLANRGASGMDGIVSTAAGVSVASGRPTALLIGDLSFLYDLNALWNLRGANGEINLVVVLLDNNGGGIFSMLPQLQSLTPEVFERVVATPSNVDIAAVVESFGIPVAKVTHMVEFVPALQKAVNAGGISVIQVPTDRERNADIHKEIHAAVGKALRG
jgi:2-succinyl-5-enolpyruvyl-6-hydroxy-3-cyclohexene-1-carboxylate synthase